MKCKLGFPFVFFAKHKHPPSPLTMEKADRFETIEPFSTVRGEGWARIVFSTVRG
jgi:hypothetical protein